MLPGGRSPPSISGPAPRNRRWVQLYRANRLRQFLLLVKICKMKQVLYMFFKFYGIDMYWWQWAILIKNCFLKGFTNGFIIYYRWLPSLFAKHNIEASSKSSDLHIADIWIMSHKSVLLQVIRVDLPRPETDLELLLRALFSLSLILLTVTVR